jgi:transcriptional regulator with XRE-family HTH domain|nr:helix-turn-helix transcriptional regulator [[Ruminococcus] lactaris]
MEHDIGSKIKAARLDKKLTQEQVAEILGVSRQTISNWENEKSYPCFTFIGIFLEAGLKPLCNGSFRQLPMLPF